MMVFPCLIFSLICSLDALYFGGVRCTYWALGESMKPGGKVNNFVVAVFCYHLFCRPDGHPNVSKHHYFFSNILVCILFYCNSGLYCFLFILLIISLYLRTIFSKIMMKLLWMWWWKLLTILPGPGLFSNRTWYFLTFFKNYESF